MRRRDFLTAFGGAALWQNSVRAQQAIPTVGFLDSRTADAHAPFAAAFRRGLKEGGVIEGKDANIDVILAQGHPERLNGLAAETVARKPAVILAGGGIVTALALKKFSSSIPIVFVNGGDAVKTGLVQSISHPGGTMTGVSFLATQIVAKRLELLLEFVPKARSIAVLVNPRNPDFAAMKDDIQGAEQTLKKQFTVYRASSEAEIDTAFKAMGGSKPDALLIGGDAYFNGVRHKLVELTKRHALPSIFDVREFAAEGGLMSYGTSQTDAYRQSGVYVTRILQGTKAADLPVLQSTRFELVINVATAKALGLDVPNKLMALADEIVE